MVFKVQNFFEKYLTLKFKSILANKSFDFYANEMHFHYHDYDNYP
jgi:hypothetical protein